MNILVTAPYNEEARRVLEEQIGSVIYRPWKVQGRAYNEGELERLLRETDADALITEHDQVSERVIRSSPNLEFIGVCRGTPSNVALDAATECGIPVFFTPARNAQAVTEMFISNLIMLYRQTLPAIAWLKGGHWGAGAHTSYLQFKGNELAGKTVGMVGFGAIGQRIANILKSFPCAVQFYDPFVEDYDPAFKKVSLEEVFSTSEIVSVHLPVNDTTRGMIDGKLLQLMRPDAVFVNTARAAVVESADLLDALKGGRIQGAVLDVFDKEPPGPVDEALIHLPNVLATPHIAGATHEVEDHHAAIMNAALAEWFASEKTAVRLLVNKEAIQI